MPLVVEGALVGNVGWSKIGSGKQGESHLNMSWTVNKRRLVKRVEVRSRRYCGKLGGANVPRGTLALPNMGKDGNRPSTNGEIGPPEVGLMCRRE
jgi:hypothetical protein